MANRGCSLLVRNLRFETSPEKVREVFEKVGKVKDVYLPIDHNTREPRGFGFVEYYDEQDAQNAVQEFDKSDLDGNEITVIVAQDRRKSPHTMRKIIAERQNGGRFPRGGPMDYRDGGYGGYGGRYDGRPGRYDGHRGYDGGRGPGGYRGDYYDRRGRDGYDGGYGGYDDRRRGGYRGGYEDRRPRGGRSRSRSPRGHDDYRGERNRYPPEEGRHPRSYDRERNDDYPRDRNDDYSRGPPSVH